MHSYFTLVLFFAAENRSLPHPLRWVFGSEFPLPKHALNTDFFLIEIKEVLFSTEKNTK